MNFGLVFLFISGMYRVWTFVDGVIADWRPKDDRYSIKGIQVLLVNAICNMINIEKHIYTLIYV